jgi:hypothetical protein
MYAGDGDRTTRVMRRRSGHPSLVAHGSRWGCDSSRTPRPRTPDHGGSAQASPLSSASSPLGREAWRAPKPGMIERGKIGSTCSRARGIGRSEEQTKCRRSAEAAAVVPARRRTEPGRPASKSKCARRRIAIPHAASVAKKAHSAGNETPSGRRCQAHRPRSIQEDG